MMTPRRLYRSSRERMLCGVAGGVGEYFNIDPVLVRVGFVFLGFVCILAIPLYFVMAIVIPLGETDSTGPAGTPPAQPP